MKIKTLKDFKIYKFDQNPLWYIISFSFVPSAIAPFSLIYLSFIIKIYNLFFITKLLILFYIIIILILSLKLKEEQRIEIKNKNIDLNYLLWSTLCFCGYFIFYSFLPDNLLKYLNDESYDDNFFIGLITLLNLLISSLYIFGQVLLYIVLKKYFYTKYYIQCSRCGKLNEIRDHWFESNNNFNKISDQKCEFCKENLNLYFHTQVFPSENYFLK